MSAFDYLLIPAAVILGMAISDLAISLQRLLGAGKAVKWDFLSPMAALLAFARILAQWWSWYGARTIAGGLTFGMFFAVLAGATMLFLMAGAALPDEIEEPEMDLRAYFEKIHRRYWLLFAAQWVLQNVVNIWIAVQVEHARVDVLSPLYLIPVVAALLAFTPKRGWQAAGLAGFIALYAVVYAGRTLG